MATIIPSYTQCTITVHIQKEFQLQLVKPSDAALQEFKNEFAFNKLDVDRDDDVVCAGGRWAELPGAVAKEITAYLSKQTIQIILLRGSTNDCFRVLYRFLQVAYRTQRDAVDAGIYYIEYNTITKVKFAGPIYNLFGDSMQKQIAEWTDLTSGALVNPVANGRWQDSSKGAIDIGAERFERMYKGQPSAIVIPSTVAFTLYVPTKFSRMTHYDVKIMPESVEDFHEDLYFIQTEFPYETHLKLAERIEKM